MRFNFIKEDGPDGIDSHYEVLDGEWLREFRVVPVTELGGKIVNQIHVDTKVWKVDESGNKIGPVPADEAINSFELGIVEMMRDALNRLESKERIGIVNL